MALLSYLFPKGMSVMIMSTELVLMGRLHKSQRTVSMGSPDMLFERKSSRWSQVNKSAQKYYLLMAWLLSYLPLSALRFWMWQILLTVRLTAMS